MSHVTVGACRPVMKVAVEGCCHGELDKIYETILRVEEREGIKIDLLICCGDFQAVRDDADLNCMAVPQKYRQMNTFYKYYSGEKVAPVMTLFVGGNHEASNHLWELSYGGWVAPKIYYLGNAGVVRYGGLRIGGLSGIYKARDYGKGHFECPPYSEDTKRSAYHVRSCDIFRLKQLSGQVDIFVSHDWPQGVYHHGNKEELLRFKPFFAEEIATDTLGSPPAMELLKLLKPLYWFSAHLHVKFAAVFRHEEEGRHTKFLALDKCLPRRKFLQILDIPTIEEPCSLDYDPEWLAILRSTEPLMRYSPALWLPPHPMTDERHTFTPSLEEIENVHNLFHNNLHVPDNFTQTVSPYNPVRRINFRAVAQPHENPQTTEFCRKLCIHNPFTPSFKSAPSGGFWVSQCAPNPDEIPLSGSDDDDNEPEGNGAEEKDGELPPKREGSGEGANPDEIAISDSEEERNSADTSTSTSAIKQSERAITVGEGVATVSRTPLVLPEPECVRGASTLEGEDIQLMEESGLSEGQALSHGGGGVVPRPDGDPQLTTPAGEEGSGQMRKIKRRNLAIYATREDQEEL